MKLRFYPKKTIVLAQFNAKKEEAQGDLNVLHAKRSEREVAILYVSAQDKKSPKTPLTGPCLRLTCGSPVLTSWRAMTRLRS